MKRFSSKKLLPTKTKTLFRFAGAGRRNGTDTTIGQTDPTSSTITILTTVSGALPGYQ